MKYILKHKKDKWTVALTFFENGDLNIVEFPKDFLKMYSKHYGNVAHNFEKISLIVRENPTLLEFTIVQADLSFNAIWNFYDYKHGKKQTAEKLWKGLTDNEKALVFMAVKKYKAWLQTTTTAQCYFETYLRQRRWENEN